MWTEIAKYILSSKFKEVCSNITRKGYRSELSDDLYQEVILSMLEKVHNQSAPILRAWENNYIDWYIVSAAHNIFISNNGSNFAKLKYVSSSTGDTNVQYVATDTEGEVEYDEMIKLCESELAEQYWYNARLFAQYVYQDSSIRKIEKKTGIPRNSIHRTLKETRERLRLVCGEKLKRLAV